MQLLGRIKEWVDVSIKEGQVLTREWWGGLVLQVISIFIRLQSIIALQGSMSQSIAMTDYSYSSSFDLKSETSTEGEEAEFRHESLACSSHLVTYRGGCSKAKSSLCKNFMEKGYCPYGGKCQFAHGPEELRINLEHNRSYKTKGCHAFAKKGYCCYGSRCNFIHEQTSAHPLESHKWKAIYSNHRQTFQGMQQSDSSRLLSILTRRI